jgi:hypothetical protein
LAAESETGSTEGESVPATRGNKSAAINFCMIHECTLVKGCHALSHVTHHAPNKPMITPISGLETANQNGITSLNGMASGATIAVSKIVFMLFILLFDLAAAIARVLDV